MNFCVGKSRKSGSQTTGREYTKGNFYPIRFDGTLEPDLCLKDMSLEFDSKTFTEVLKLLKETTQSVVSKITHVTPNCSQPKNMGDEVAIIQQEIKSLCGKLVDVFKNQFGPDNLFFTPETPYADGRIDFTFHIDKYMDIVTLGMIECKKSSLKISNDGLCLTNDGKKAIVQASRQLDSQRNKLVDGLSVETMAMVSLLTNGKSWILLRKQLLNGKGVFYHSHEVVLIDDTNKVMTEEDEAWPLVGKMILALFYCMKLVLKDINAKKMAVPIMVSIFPITLDNAHILCLV
jgi:hypothetical protein